MDHIQLCRAAKCPVPQKVSHFGPAFKSPKSVGFTWRGFLLVTRILLGLISRCTIWFLLCEGASGLTDPKEELTGNPLTKGCSSLLESQGERTQEPSILTIEAGSFSNFLVRY
jgi:hypothetical protein